MSSTLLPTSGHKNKAFEDKQQDAGCGQVWLRRALHTQLAGILKSPENPPNVYMNALAQQEGDDLESADSTPLPFAK